MNTTAVEAEVGYSWGMHSSCPFLPLNAAVAFSIDEPFSVELSTNMSAESKNSSHRISTVLLIRL